MSNLLDLPPSIQAAFQNKTPQNFAVLKLAPNTENRRAPKSGTWPPVDDDPRDPTSSYDAMRQGRWGQHALGGPKLGANSRSPPRVHDASFAQWEMNMLPKGISLPAALDTIAKANLRIKRLLKIKLKFNDGSEMVFCRPDGDPDAASKFRFHHEYLPNATFERKTARGKAKLAHTLTPLVDAHGHRSPRRGGALPPLRGGAGGAQVGLGLRYPTSDERKAVFMQLDPNGNGMLSLAELDRGVQILWPSMNNKPAIMRAYKAADVNGTGFIGKREFKFFLKYLQYYDELFHKFSAVDKSGDRRVTLAEMQGASASLGLPRQEVEKAFQQMDRNQGGYVLFDEFAMWMAKYRADKELGGGLMARAAENKVSYTPVLSRSQCSSHASTKSVKKRRKMPALDFPTSQSRKELFQRLDPNGNGYLSLAELDKGILELWPQFNHKPAIMRAYKAAETSGDGWLRPKEFKKFLKYIYHFTELWNAFADIDSSDDRRVTKQELSRAGSLLGMSQPELMRAFDVMDTNKGGFVLFDEFCLYMAKHKADVELTVEGNSEA